MPDTVSLCDINPDEAAIVKRIEIDGPMKNRLIDIGLIPGTLVKCVGISPCKDPKAYLIRGAVIAIRSEDSRNIRVVMRGGKNEN